MTRDTESPSAIRKDDSEPGFCQFCRTGLEIPPGHNRGTCKHCAFRYGIKPYGDFPSVGWVEVGDSIP